MLRSAMLALSLALFGAVAVADEAPIPQGYASPKARVAAAPLISTVGAAEAAML